MRIASSRLSGADAGDFRRGDRLIERHADEALRGQVVDFARARSLEQPD